MRLLGAFLALLALAGCITPPPTNLVFGEQSKSSLVLIVSPNIFTNTGETFQRVDLENSRFRAESFSVENTLIGTSNKVIGTGKLMVSMISTDPGDYALKEYRINFSDGIVGGVKFRCNNSASLVYNVQAGKVTVIFIYPPWREEVRPGVTTPEDIANAARLALSKYPSVFGEPVYARPSRFIRWQTGFGECSVPASFELY